jgi:hypothetical protein
VTGAPPEGRKTSDGSDLRKTSAQPCSMDRGDEIRVMKPWPI